MSLTNGGDGCLATGRAAVSRFRASSRLLPHLLPPPPPSTANLLVVGLSRACWGTSYGTAVVSPPPVSGVGGAQADGIDKSA